MARDLDASNRERIRLASRVFERYGALIRAIITHNVEDQSIADDIYQNVFLSIVHKPVPSEGNIEAYLYKLVLMTCQPSPFAS